MSNTQRFMLLCALLFVCLGFANAQIRLETTAYVVGTNPTAAYPASSKLPVESAITSYLRFDVDRTPPYTCGKTVLRLHVNSVATPGKFDVFEVSGNWDNTRLTYQSAPSLGVSATGNHPVAVSYSDIGRFIDVDITSVVQKWVNKTAPNNGIALALIGADATPGTFSFDGIQREGVTANPPELLQLEACEKYDNVLPVQLVKCVAAHDDCPDQTKDAEDQWIGAAEIICNAHPCSKANLVCSRSSAKPVSGKNENPDDNDCKRRDATKPKGCYSYAVGNVQCKCMV